MTPNPLRLASAAFLALLLASVALGQDAILSAKVVGITDGDTVKALVAGNGFPPHKETQLD